MIIRSITRFFQFLTQTAPITRLEILLPLTYNDGTTIEDEKFELTADELTEHFGGITEDVLRATGTWKYGGARYRDELLRLRIDSDHPKAVAFLKSYKRVLKARFQQIDIWITAHDIHVL
jgi:hypothetical protein